MLCLVELTLKLEPTDDAAFINILICRLQDNAGLFDPWISGSHLVTKLGDTLAQQPQSRNFFRDRVDAKRSSLAV